jgi:hypothetical protein
MLLKPKVLRRRGVSRTEIVIGAALLLLVVLMTVLAIFLNLWWLKQEEEDPSERNPKPAVTSTTVEWDPISRHLATFTVQALFLHIPES